jgi:hypothetical protein
MNTGDKEPRIESAPDANNQNGYQGDFDEIRRVLEAGIENIEQLLLEYFHPFNEVEDRDRAKEQERIGKTSEGSSIPRSETQTGNAA